VSKERLDARRVTLDRASIAAALSLQPAEVDRLFRDGRIMSGFAEVWASHLFGFRPRANRNARITGAVAADLTHEVQVRVLVEHIYFHPSGNQGKGREAKLDDVVAALERVETFVVVDVRCWPAMNFYPLDTKRLLAAVHSRQLGTGGWSAKRFDEWLGRSFAVSLVPARLVEHAA
jgi:hypothetical protein